LKRWRKWAEQGHPNETRTDIPYDVASIALEAANPAYETRIFGPDRVRVQGRLVGLIRRY